MAGPWEIVAAGAFTLGGVVVGQVMTSRASRDAFALQLAEDRRVQIHGELAELVIAARAKLDAGEVLIPAYWKMTTQDLTEFMDTDTGRLEADRQANIAAALVRLGLGLRDGPFRVALANFESHWNDWADRAVGPVMDKTRKQDIEAVVDGLKHVRATRAALKEVQVQAALALAVDPAPVTAPSWSQMARQRLQQIWPRRKHT